MNLEAFHFIGPAIVLLAGAVLVLLADLATGRRACVRPLAMLTLAAAALYAATQAAADTGGQAFGGAIGVDRFTIYVALLLIVITAAVVVAGEPGLTRVAQRGEFYALLLASTASMMLLAQARDLVAIFVALETTSAVQYILVGLGRDARASEAGLKYLLTGAIAAAVLLYGFVLLFGIAGSTSLADISRAVAETGDETRLAVVVAFVLIAAGVGFKMAIVPFHAWVPDVYQGAATPVTVFLSAASKAAGFAIALRLFYTGLGGGDTPVSADWAKLFGVLAAVSMTLGNLAAIQQTDVKRLLGYSSIAQAGNIAVGLAAVATGSTLGPAAVLFFLGTYAATNLGAFIAVIAVGARVGSDELRDYAGLLRRSPGLAIVLVLCLLSLTGLPPTAGFLAKLYVFNSAVQGGEQWLVWLVVVAVFNTALSAYYYLRWARTILLDEPLDPAPFQPPAATNAVLTAAALGVLFFGIVPTPLIDAARSAAAALA
ncbi:MAG: NADH-quinone oxidoreductase subunit N [Chloroflexi bacterium]|nr:NADH-quinone oxidoreductase subunit N [Chloroflexota bacterium]